MHAGLTEHKQVADTVLRLHAHTAARPRLRFASADEARLLDADLEILPLAGSVSTDASHLHSTLAAPDGHVFGRHVVWRCIVRTTAEVLIALLDAWGFGREHDAAAEYDEQAIRRRVAAPGTPT